MRKAAVKLSNLAGMNTMESIDAVYVGRHKVLLCVHRCHGHLNRGDRDMQLVIDPCSIQ